MQSYLLYFTVLCLHIKALLRSDPTSQDFQRVQDQKKKVYLSKWRLQRAQEQNLYSLSVLEMAGF